MTLPVVARTIAGGVTDAVAAAQATDAAQFAASTARLATVDREQVGLVLGAVVRSLLEQTHPDGLAADDLRAVAVDLVGSATAWLPDVDPPVVVDVLVGALGVHDPDAEPVDALVVTRHAVLLTAHLLTSAGRPLAAALEAAFAEIARAETHD